MLGAVPLIGLRLGVAVTVHRQEQFGGRADDGDVVDADVCAERRRITTTQSEVQFQRIDVDGGRELIGQADLVALARPDLREGGVDRGRVLGA